MSSCPGTTLELFLAWNYNLVIIGEVDPNFSLSVAESCGMQPRRRRLTIGQFEFITELYEEFRESIEERLTDYNEEEHGSWRTYGSLILDACYTEQQIKDLDSVVFSYLNTLGK